MYILLFAQADDLDALIIFFAVIICLIQRKGYKQRLFNVQSTKKKLNRSSLNSNV